MDGCELKVCRPDGGRDGGFLVRVNLRPVTGSGDTGQAGVRFQSGRVSLVIKSVPSGGSCQNLPHVHKKASKSSVSFPF